MWARQLAAQSGVHLVNQACEHYYLITEAMSEVDKTLPVLEDPKNYAYIRPEAGGLMVGLFEGQGQVRRSREPWNFYFILFFAFSLTN